MSDQAGDPSVSVTGVKDACSYRPGPADEADCPDDWEGERERERDNRGNFTSPLSLIP